MASILGTAAVEAQRAFAEWRRAFEARSDVRIVFERMRQRLARKNSENFSALHLRVLIACFNAQALKISPHSDDPMSYQTQIIALRKQHDELQKALRIVLEVLEQSSLVSSIAIMNGRKELHSKLPLAGHRTGYAEKLAEVLEAFERGVPLLLARDRTEKSFTNRVAGCLEYPSEIHLNQSKPDVAMNGLTFELALLFKQWSTTQSPNIDHLGQWHDEGRPEYSLIADLINVALDVPDSEFTYRKAMDRIRDLVRNHPGIRYVGWSNTYALISGNVLLRIEN